MVFNGGMPRASYGDKHTVTVMKGDEKHTVFDLSSKVSDFLVMNSDSGAPISLLILTEEELVAVDLTDDSWPVHKLPYLNPIHASAITCLTHVAQVDSQVYDKIQQGMLILKFGIQRNKDWLNLVSMITTIYGKMINSLFSE